MSVCLAFLAAHLALIVLASTCFTVVTGFTDGKFQWEYFRYFSQQGWGLPYQFSYTLPVVLMYAAAYVVGMVAFGLAWRSGSWLIGSIGMILCAVGFVSFAFESTHWLHDSYGSWIFSAPVASIVLSLLAAVQQFRIRSAQKRAPAAA